MAQEKLLLDTKPGARRVKRVAVSERPDAFRAAFSPLGQKVLDALASGPMYPAEMARRLRVHHQAVYYHVGRLERAGLIARVGEEEIRGGRANRFGLTCDGYAVEFAVPGEEMPSIASASRSGSLGRFLEEFVSGGSMRGWVVVGSPMAHGPAETQARDGHYAVQLGFALGQFVSLPQTFPVKLDVDVRAEKLERSNLVVVGGPRTNVVSEALNPYLPFRFKQGGFWGSIVDDRGKAYTSELDALVVKVANPWDGEKTCVVAAGLTGAGTKAAVIGICNEADSLFQRYRGGPFACVLRGIDNDGDGKVDGVEVLRKLGD